MKKCQPVVNENTSNGGNRGNGSNGGEKKQNRKHIEYKCSNTSKYCWLCSAWNHMSAQCKRKNLAIKMKQPYKTR